MVSSCLAGFKCRYNGESSEIKVIADLVKSKQAIPVCPEQLGGLCTPRPGCEIITDVLGNRRVVSKDQQDFTKEFYEGAKKALEIGKVNGINKAILKSRSPSCGHELIYDGTFTGKLIRGNGLTAEVLIENDIEIFTENELNKLFMNR